LFDKVRFKLLIGQAKQTCRASMRVKENPRGGLVVTANQQKYLTEPLSILPAAMVSHLRPDVP
jgi:hypothetical protein